MELMEITTDDEWQKYFPQVPWTKTQILNRIKLIKQKSATKNDAKEEPEGVVTKTNETDKEETRSGEISDTPKIPQTETIEKDKGGRECGELKGGDKSSTPVTGLQSNIVGSETIHQDVPTDKEVDKVKELFQKSKENVIDEEPGKDNSTDSIQEQVDTNLPAPNESHKANVAEDEVPKTNEVIETTTIELIETDSDKVCITGTANEVEPSMTKEPAMVEKDNSTEETTVEPKEKKENGEIITANVKVESGPNPLTCESNEYLVTGEISATFSNSKVAKYPEDGWKVINSK